MQYIKLHDTMNIFDILPPELMKIILLHLNYSSLVLMPQISSTFTNKLDMPSLLRERKILGYPRPNGYCGYHVITEQIISNDTNIFLKLLLKILYDMNTDLIRGDLIELWPSTNYKTVIFDGCELKNLDTKTDYYGCIPDEFRVFEHSVPLRYWYCDEEIDNTRHFYNNVIWLDYSSIQDQCINNIGYGLVDERNYGIFTRFTKHNIVYTVIFAAIDHLEIVYNMHKNYRYHNEDAKAKNIDLFKQILSGNPIFQYSSDEYYADINDCNTIFIDANDNNIQWR